MMICKLEYRAATQGLEHIGIATVAIPFWFCDGCGFKKERNGRGFPFETGAKKLHREHRRRPQ